MAFVVVVPAKTDAARLLHSLQTPLRIAFWARVATLEPAVNSFHAELARPGDNGQCFQFRIDIQGQSAFFMVLFQFADTRDENTLVVAKLFVNIL